MIFGTSGLSTLKLWGMLSILTHLIVKYYQCLLKSVLFGHGLVDIALVGFGAGGHKGAEAFWILTIST